MAKFKIDISDIELIQIIGEYVKETYNVKDMLTVAWQGGTPIGVVVTSEPLMKKPFEDPFKE